MITILVSAFKISVWLSNLQVKHFHCMDTYISIFLIFCLITISVAVVAGATVGALLLVLIVSIISVILGTRQKR